MTRAFVEREAGPVAHDPVCILCGDPATVGGLTLYPAFPADDLCDACRAAYDLASEHSVSCACGACLVHAKITTRHAAVSL